MASPLVGFVVEKVQPKGSIVLPIAVGSIPNHVTMMVDFLIMNVLSKYNAIIGRRTLKKLRVITSTYHLKMKFQTANEIGEVKGDQVVARRCHNTTLKDLMPKETLIVEGAKLGKSGL